MQDATAIADVELMAALRAGSSEAMSALYNRHGRAAYLLAFMMLREQGAAEDVVQDAFLTVWRKADQYDAAQASLRTWLLTIVRNRTIDVLRSGKRQRTELPLLEGLEETVGAEARSEMATGVEDGLVRARVRQVVAELPSDQRRTIELIYFGGYTYEEAARLTNAPLGTVKSRLRAAFAKLRPLLATERPAS